MWCVVFVIIFYYIILFQIIIIILLFYLFLFFPHECTHPALLRDKNTPEIASRINNCRGLSTTSPIFQHKCGITSKKSNFYRRIFSMSLPILVTSKLHMETVTNPHLEQTVLGGRPMIAGGMIPIVFCA